jgi:hypothetical protein
MRKMFVVLEILEALILSSVGLSRANPSATDPRLHPIFTSSNSIMSGTDERR